MIRILVVVLLIASGLPTTAQDNADSPVIALLKELKPLPKIHYSWPFPLDKLPDDLLFEYAHLTNAASLSGEWSKVEHVDRAVGICQRVNAAKPKMRASIGINYSVWHRRFGTDLPPADVGPTHLG